MPYIVSVVRGQDPDAPDATLTRAEIVEWLQQRAGAVAVGPRRWQYDDGSIAVRIDLPEADPGDRVDLRIGWSTAEHLAATLGFCMDVADGLSARAYDRNGRRFLSRESLAALATGFSPAREAPRRWFGRGRD